MSVRDLDSPAEIDRFVDAFYARVLADPLLAPLFTEVAAVHLETHLPRIKAYWRKMLLGDRDYDRHMMARHRAVDRQEPLAPEHYARWLLLFEDALFECCSGPRATHALALARRVAGNMRRNLEGHRLQT